MSYIDLENVRECGGCEDEENHPHAFDCPNYINPFTPTHCIRIHYKDGYSDLLTSGNSQPPNVATYPEQEAHDMADRLAAKNPKLEFTVEPIQ